MDSRALADVPARGARPEMRGLQQSQDKGYIKLMNLTERLAWVTDTIRDQIWLSRHLKIKPTDLVLDVGSGGNPHLRANVLCDKFVADATERNGQPILADRPFVVGDAERLPFADQAFDFVVCSHLLEHVANPAAVLRELKRVAPRGYIETPSTNWEKLQGFPFHRWLVSVRDGGLRFEAKRSPLWDEELQSWFRSAQRAVNGENRLWFARRRIGVFTSLLWEGQIAYEIHADDGRAGHSFAHAEVIPSREEERRAGGIAARALRRLGAHLRSASDRPWAAIERLLCCPNCRASLHRPGGAVYRCDGCEAEFPLDRMGRPWLLPNRRPEAEPLERSRERERYPQAAR
jgi:SAM-dependent methyltransferase